MQDLVNELPTHETASYSVRSRSQIAYLIVHHSAVPAVVGPSTIAHYHVKRLGWPGIGYHFVVGADGSVYQANRLETVVYHAGQANALGVGICFLGNFGAEVPPPAQLRAGAHLIAWLMQELGIGLNNVRGHREFMATECPGNQWLSGRNWKKSLRLEIGKVQQGIAEADHGQDKSMFHYVLFAAEDGKWALRDWLDAQNYIGTFQPTVGFSAEDAARAKHVTIVGGLEGISQEVEDRLKALGCEVERLAGQTQEATAKLLDSLVRQGKRFLEREPTR
jgi:hypothetical protein